MEEVTARLMGAVQNYQMPAQATRQLKRHPPLILCSVSAGGKTSTAAQITKQSNYRHVVTHTTRPIRPGEINGVNYWFVDENRMLELIQQQAFIEVNPVHGRTVYGSSLASYQSVVNSEHKPLLIMDVQGTQEVIKYLPGVSPYFILPPDYQTWMQRLKGRGQMSHSEKTRRLQSACKEIRIALDDPRFILVVNHQLKKTVQEILGTPARINQKANRELAQNLIGHIKY